MRILTITILTLSLLIGCSEIETTDPIESYKHWTGTVPADNLKVLEGKYWQSPHWSKEYILYLKIKPTDEWWREFANQNKLQSDNSDWIKPTNLPDWFILSDKMERYNAKDDFSDSRYFRDKQSGVCYIYEIQL